MLKKTLLAIAIVSLLSLPASAGWKKFEHDWPTHAETWTVAIEVSSAEWDWQDACFDIDVIMDIPFFCHFEFQGPIELLQVGPELDPDTGALLGFHFEGCGSGTVLSNFTMDITVSIASVTPAGQALQPNLAMWYATVGVGACPPCPPEGQTQVFNVAPGSEVCFGAGVHQVNLLAQDACQTDLLVATVNVEVRPSSGP